MNSSRSAVIARRFAREGAKVAVGDLNSSAAKNVAGKIDASRNRLINCQRS